MPKWFARKENKEDVFVGVETDDELVNDITEKLKAFERETSRIRRQWLVNSAFVRGQQFALLYRNEDRMINLQAPPGRKQIMDNMIGPWRDHMVANMVRAIPSFEAVPENYDSDAVSAARMSSSLLNYYWEDWRFLIQYIQLCGYLIDFGNGFVFANYETNTDKYTTDSVIDPDTGLAKMGDDGNPAKVKRSLDDITSRVLMPHSIACLLDSTPLDEKPWVDIVQRRTLDYFREHYKNGDEVLGEAQHEIDTYNIKRISDVSSDGGEKSQEYANEIVYMQKPSDLNPDGLVCVIAGNVLLEPKKDGESRRAWPYQKLMTYPLEHFHFPKEPSEFFARSRVENQIPLQKSLNLLWCIIMENAESMGYQKWLIPVQGNVGEISDINETIEYTFPFKPELSDLKPLPDFIAGTAIDRLKSAIRDLQNYHGASLGGAVSGVRSDLHAQNLQEQDLLPLTTVDNIMQAAFEKLGEKILMIAAEKLSEERIISYTGKNERIMYENFKGSMLGDTKRVKVKLTNTFMRTKNAVTQRIYEFFQAGLITDQYGQKNPVEAMRLLEFALPDSVNKDMQIHTEMAYKENDSLMTGQPVWVLPHQNHNIHISTHQEFQNSSDYMKLYEELGEQPENQQIIERFNKHIMEHYKMQAKAQGMLQKREPQKENRPAEKAERKPQGTAA